MVFYESYYDAIRLLPDDKRLEAYDAVMGYEFDGIEPEELSWEVEMVFTIIRPMLDSIKAKREGGKKGGRPRKETSETENKNHRFSDLETIGSEKEKPNDKDKDKEKVKVKDKEKDKEKVKEKENISKESVEVMYDPDIEVDNAIRDFIRHRKALRKPMTDKAIDLFVAKLNRMTSSPARKVQLIDNAIEHGWLSVYEDNGRKGAKEKMTQRDYDFEDIERKILEVRA